MKGIVVPLMSVALYLLIYAVIVLVKPPTTDHIRNLHTSTHPLILSLTNIIHFHAIAFDGAEIGGLNRQGQSQQLQGYRNVGSQDEFINTVSHSRSQWKIFQTAASVQEQDDGLQTSTSYLYLYNNKFPCNLPLNASKQTRLASLEHSIKQKLGLLYKKDKLRSQTLYRVFDGLQTHFKLLSSRFAPNHSRQNELQQIAEKEQLGNNLLFVYENTAKTIKTILSANNISVRSQDLTADLHATRILVNMNATLQNFTLDNYNSYWRSIYTNQQLLSQYHQLSAIFKADINRECQVIINSHIRGFANVLECQYSQKSTHTLDEFIELVTFFDALSSSVQIYYQIKRETVKLQHMKSWLDHTHVYYFLFGLGFVVVYMFLQIDIEKKIKKQFKHAFPPDKRFRVQ